MLIKLALKNAKNSFKDSAIYFLTLVLAVSIFYMFNSIGQQSNPDLEQVFNIIDQVMNYFSEFIAVILGFLIVYANNFFIKRRKKEFGIYMTLGLSRAKVAMILIVESILIALVALVIGIIIGVAGSQLMSLFTVKMFDADLSSFTFVFSKETVFKVIKYFGIMFVIAMLVNIVTIGKLKLIDLIYAQKKSEKLKIKNMKISISIFILSIVMIGFAYYEILDNGFTNTRNLGLSVAFGSIGTFLFFLSVSSMLVVLIKAREKTYFKGLNIFIFRQLASRINTNVISITVVCIALLLVMGTFSTGYSIQNSVSKYLSPDNLYDVSVAMSGESKKNNIEEVITSNVKEVKKENIFKFNIYNDGENLVPDYTKKNGEIREEYKSFFMSLSDFNKLLKIKGKNPINLGNNKTLIVSGDDQFTHVAESILKENKSVKIKGKDFIPEKKIEEFQISNGTMVSHVFVLNDKEISSNDRVELKLVNIQTGDKKISEKIGNALFKDKMISELKNASKDEQKRYEEVKLLRIIQIFTKEDVAMAGITLRVLISFISIYMGLIFMIACATILSIQQLSEVEDNKFRYGLLRKLGAEKKILNRALFTQVAFYFALPMVLAILHAVVGLTAMNKVLEKVSIYGIGTGMVTTGLFIFVLYGIYFILTYMSSKKIVSKEIGK